MTAKPHQATISLRAVIENPREETVLVVRRANDGNWELPGGRLSEAEPPTKGLKREVREETGQTIAVKEPVYTTAWQNDAGQDRFAVYYRCGMSVFRDVNLSHEHTDFAWLHPKHAIDRLQTPGETAIKQAVSMDGVPVRATK